MKKHIAKRATAVAVGLVTLLSSAMALSTAGFTTSAASDDYENFAKLLQYSLYFYDANMCGTEVGETSAITWRDDCHTDDAVTGGFHDAGDHVKFGLPAGYAASTLGWSYYEYGDSFDDLGLTDHLQTITDYFCDYFKDCTTLSNGTVTNLIYQIGDGNADHAEWCAPEVQDSSSRTVYSTSSGASDIAGEYAAALAVNYINFHNDEDLTYAKALFDFSTQYNTRATDGTGGFYDSSSYYDDQAWAAGWLYLATGDATYKTFLNTYANTSNAGTGSEGCQWGVYTTYCWDNVSAGAVALQAEITGDSSEWDKISTTLFNNKNVNTSSTSYYCESAWGSCRYNTAMQSLTLLVDKYYKSSAGYADWAKNQMGIILGNNNINTCFVTGLYDNSAKYAHHRAASGYTSSNEMTNQVGYSSNGHTLIGALVGGPTSSDISSSSYTDTIQDYTCNEVAIDYNATLVFAAAGLYDKYRTGSTDDSIEGVDMTASGSSGSSDTGSTGDTSGSTGDTSGSTGDTSGSTGDTSGGSSSGGSTGGSGSGSTGGPGSSSGSSDSSSSDNTGSGSSGSSSDVTVSNGELTVGQELGDSGDYYYYVDVTPGDAVSMTLYFTVTSSDTSASGGFGYWNGAWNQTDFNVSVPSDKVVSVDYTFESTESVKAMIFWPGMSGVDASSIYYVLHYADSSSSGSGSGNTGSGSTGGSSSGNTGSGSSGSSSDVTVSNGELTVGQELGDSGDYYYYVDVTPGDAVSMTLYFTVTSSDTSASGGFGYWNGTWNQTDFNVSVPSDKVVSVDYTFESTESVKAMIFWPGTSGVDASSIYYVLHYADSSSSGSGSGTTGSGSTSGSSSGSTGSGSGSSVSATLYGDATEDGKINLSDVIYIAKAGNNIVTINQNTTAFANADVNSDGSVNGTDAMLVMQFQIGTVSTLPV